MIGRLLAAAVFLGTVLNAMPARADLALGVGASGNFGVGNDVVTLPNSWSVDGLVGYRFKLDILELTPELDLTYARSIGTLATHQVDWSFQAAAGGRVGLALGIVVPSAYFHFGLGNVELVGGDLVKLNKTGPYYEVGGALDLRLADMFSLGLQVGYGSVSLSNIEATLDNASVKRLRAGLHFTFYL